jgi:hypothetical protein
MAWRRKLKIIRSKVRIQIAVHLGYDYEECRLLWYKNPVHTSQETHYVTITEPSWLMLCKIWGFHGGDYEECRLLGYKNHFCTAQETLHVSATELSRLILCKIWGFHGSNFWDVAPFGSCWNCRYGGRYRLHLQGRKNKQTWSNVSSLVTANIVPSLLVLSTLKMGSTCSAEPSVLTRSTWRHISEKREGLLE